MITVQNDRIRVTVTQEIWDSFSDAAQRLAHKQVLPSGDVHIHSPEKILRGLVLSEAMTKLGSASELKSLENEELDNTEITKLAKLTLMRNYLEKRGRYNTDDLMWRYEGGKMMSLGMQHFVLEAESYAQGLLSPLSEDDAWKDLKNYISKFIASGTEPAEHEIRTKKKLMDLRMGKLGDEAAADAAMTQAEDSLNFCRNIDRNYLKSRADMDGWQIEVIGEMPDQIGLSRYSTEVSA
jgi:hypothetical protein